MNSYSCVIKEKDVEIIKSHLESRGFLFDDLPYGYFKAKSKQSKVNISVYKSLKCLIQGKGTEDFVQFFLEPNILKKISSGYEHLDYEEKIGMDESGKGDYFGPLVVASVFVPENRYQILKKSGVMDSKKISDKKIPSLAKLIKEECKYEVLILFPDKYNELYQKINNLNALLAWTHTTCLKNILQKTNCKNVLLDKFGPAWRIEQQLKRKNISVSLTQKTKAESDLAVACASIIARDSFLVNMLKMSKNYDISFPKGGGNQTIKTGKTFVEMFNKNELVKVAKLHFKNTEKIID